MRFRRSLSRQEAKHVISVSQSSLSWPRKAGGPLSGMQTPSSRDSACQNDADTHTRIICAPYGVSDSELARHGWILPAGEARANRVKSSSDPFWRRAAETVRPNGQTQPAQNCRLTPGPRCGSIGTRLVSPKNKSPSPAHRSVHAGARRSNSYQLNIRGNCYENETGIAPIGRITLIKYERFCPRSEFLHFPVFWTVKHGGLSGN